MLIFLGAPAAMPPVGRGSRRAPARRRHGKQAQPDWMGGGLSSRQIMHSIGQGRFSFVTAVGRRNGHRSAASLGGALQASSSSTRGRKVSPRPMSTSAFTETLRQLKLDLEKGTPVSLRTSRLRRGLLKLEPGTRRRHGKQAQPDWMGGGLSSRQIMHSIGLAKCLREGGRAHWPGRDLAAAGGRAGSLQRAS